jgi:hypothetical protein
MGEAPVLEAGGKKHTQSGAILLYLAETTGKFAPENDEERNEALRWILFDNHKFTNFFATYRFLRAFGPAGGSVQAIIVMVANLSLWGIGYTFMAKLNNQLMPHSLMLVCVFVLSHLILQS